MHCTSTQKVTGSEIDRQAVARASTAQLPKLAQMLNMGWQVMTLRSFNSVAGGGTEIHLAASTGAKAVLKADGQVVR